MVDNATASETIVVVVVDDNNVYLIRSQQRVVQWLSVVGQRRNLFVQRQPRSNVNKILRAFDFSLFSAAQGMGSRDAVAAVMR